MHGVFGKSHKVYYFERKPQKNLRCLELLYMARNWRGGGILKPKTKLSWTYFFPPYNLQHPFVKNEALCTTLRFSFFPSRR